MRENAATFHAVMILTHFRSLFRFCISKLNIGLKWSNDSFHKSFILYERKQKLTYKMSSSLYGFWYGRWYFSFWIGFLQIIIFIIRNCSKFFMKFCLPSDWLSNRKHPLKKTYIDKCLNQPLTHYRLVLPFYTPWKNQKTIT